MPAAGIAKRLHDMWENTTKGNWEFPPKPSRMRWKTQWRLNGQYDERLQRWVAGVWALWLKLCQGHGRCGRSREQLWHTPATRVIGGGAARVDPRLV
jgi:hypothetical protein